MDLFPFYSPLENCALITWKPFSVIVESRFKNTRFIPTPRYYRQFASIQSIVPGERKPLHFL